MPLRLADSVKPLHPVSVYPKWDATPVKATQNSPLKSSFSFVKPIPKKHLFMDYIKGKVTKLMVDYFESDFRRINHALEVMRHSEMILETIQYYDYEIIIASALLHDIGIKQSEKELGYNNGKTQEKYGPPIAEKLLNSINFPPDKVIKVCEIIGNHHTPSRYDYIELEILKKADKIVNNIESRI